ncbi:General alpha-glucoside permease [Colletotrichum aenigma]|uniref:General alpha-glucoside permease n=1 Tax=Colletotrichum aenigma TaxID=1215731 RepID=UPI00187231BE|nr:General alpha-glucoside permease [Colletotrichum aenigma]KAF5526974.1 General alpha-glucoside permease [Colletotrichum aenigma]
MTSNKARSPRRGRPLPNIDQSNPPSKTNSTQTRTLSGSTARNGSTVRDKGIASERSPLLSPSSDEDGFTDGNTVMEEQDDLQQTKSVWYLILLTISIGGLQIAWSVELSNGSPYLLSLGLSKSLMALVWIAGPLTGTLVQPYVGMLSDNCRLPWGKRKPFMVGGAIATMVSLMFLAWTREIVGGFLGIFGADPESQGVKTAIICVAVVGIYVLDFAINTVQAAIRAFIVDCAPAHQQEAANAMASRITGFGNIVGYIAGYIDLPKYVWFLGDTQFKVLCAIASIALASTILVSTTLIHERDPRLEGPPAQSKAGVLPFFGKIFTSIKRLPPQVMRVCQVQFCAWVGFFPLLFYTSSYIGEIYVEPFLEKNPHMAPEELDKLYEQATRVGTFALLINSIVSLATNVFLPFFIAPTYDSHPVLCDVPGETDAAPKDFDSEKPSFLDRLQIPGFTLKRAWFMSLWLFAGAMFCTVIVRTVEAATALIGLVGITWAMTLWAPWAIISAEISRRDAVLRARQRHLSPSRRSDGPASPSLNSIADSDRSVLSEGEETDQAGVILGIHNMAIAAPQIIATVGSSIIFKIWQKPRGTPGDHSMAIVLALGGIAVLVSSFFVAAIKESSSLPADAMVAAEEGDSTGGRSRPGTGHVRNKSYEQLPRVSIKRATLTRNKSFGGAEY